MSPLLRRFLILGVCGGLAGCGAKPAAESDATPTPEVRVARAESRSLPGTVEAPGQWKASLETVVPVPFDAIIESLTVRPGGRVARGATVAWCRTLESDAALRGAELMLRQATDPAGHRDAARALAEARASVIRVPIAAPTSGTVLRRQAEAGSRLTSGSELVAIVSDDALVFEARVPLDETDSVRPGMQATISDGDGPPHASQVWTFPPASAGDQSTLVWLRPASPPPHPAMARFGTASIATGRTIRGLAVPDTAVVEDDLTGSHRIAVLDSGNVVRWINVQLGPREGHARIVAAADLAPGSAIVVDGQRALVDGVRVVIHP